MPPRPEDLSPASPALREAVVHAVAVEIIVQQRLAAAAARRDRRIAWQQKNYAAYLAKIEADYAREVAAAEKMRARFPRKL
jgi:hypothetical protein